MAKITSFLMAALLLTVLLAADLGAAEADDSSHAGVSVSDIVASSREDGVTVLEITTDRQLEPGMFFYFRIAGASPREVLCLRNVLRPYRQRQLPVGDSNVARIRFGYHPETTPPELHIVLDLASDEVDVQRVTADGTRLVMELARPSVSEPPAAAAAVTGDDLVAEQTDNDAEPVVAAVQPAEEHEQPTGATGNADDTGAPDVAESTTPVGSEAETEEVAGPSLPAITGIDTEVQGDGSTVVTLSASAPFPPNSVRGLYFAGAPPQYALSILGTRLSGVPGRLAATGPSLQEIEVYSYPDRQPPEVQLMLVLSSGSVQVLGVSKLGPKLVVRLAAP